MFLKVPVIIKIRCNENNVLGHILINIIMHQLSMGRRLSHLLLDFSELFIP